MPVHSLERPLTLRAHGLRQGFTMTEILVVIVVIIILAALLFPLVGKVRSAAHTSTCVANLRELSVHVQGQVAETGYYPPINNHATNDNGSLRHTGNWLGKHINDLECSMCPAAKFTGYRDNGRPITAYGANPMVMGWQRDGEPPLIRPTQITRPSEVMLMSDGAQFDNGPHPRALGYNARWWGTRLGNEANGDKGLTSADIIPGGFWDDDMPTIPLRHNGRANILFCDGHVSSIGKHSELKERNLYWNY